jgi:hypothetical protein
MAILVLIIAPFFLKENSQAITGWGFWKIGLIEQ